MELVKSNYSLGDDRKEKHPFLLIVRFCVNDELHHQSSEEADGQISQAEELKDRIQLDFEGTIEMELAY